MNGINVGLAHLHLAGKQVSMFHINPHASKSEVVKGKRCSRKHVFCVIFNLRGHSGGGKPTFWALQWELQSGHGGECQRPCVWAWDEQVCGSDTWGASLKCFFDIMHWCTVVCTYAATDSIHISLISPSRGSVQTFPLCCSRNSLPLRARSPNQRNHGVLPNILVLIVTVVRPYQILGIGFPRVRLHQWRIKVSVVPAGHFPRRAPWKEPCILVEAQPKKEESKMWKCLSEIMRNASQKLKSDANPNGLMFEGNEWSKREEHKLSRG